MLTQRWLSLGLLLIGSACSTALPGPHFEVTNPGTGAPNADPLLPLSVGYRTGDQVVDAMVESGHGPLLRLSSARTPLYSLYLVDERGVFFAGGVDDGVLDEPALIVPRTVRAGMKWTVSQKGVATLLFEVTSRSTAPTRFGAQPTWTIVATSLDGTPPVGTTYVEGRGSENTVTVFPDAPAAAALKRRPLELEEIPFDGEGYSAEPSMIRVGSGRALLLGTTEKSDRGVCRFFDGTRLLTDQPPSAQGPFARTDGPACIFTQECFINQNHVDVCTPYSSGYAGGAHVSPDGTIAWVPRARGGGPIASTANSVGVTSAHEPSAVALGHISGAGAGGRVVFGGVAGLSLDDPTGSGTRLASTWMLLPSIRRVVALKTEANGETPFLLIDGSGMFWTARLRASGEQPLPIAAGFLSGVLSVLATEAGHEVLRVTPDGEIDRLTVAPEQGGLVLEHLANVTLAKGEAAVGAWRWKEAAGDRLIVASLSPGPGLEGLRNHLYRSREFLGQPVQVTVPASLRIIAGGAGGSEISNGSVDGFVCWAPGLEKPAVSTFTVAGAAPGFLGYRDGSSCALLLGAGDAVIGGTFPGTGRAFLQPSGGHFRGMDHASTYDFMNPIPIAPLRGGGFVTTQRVYGPGGLLEGRPRFGDTATSQSRFEVDLKGGGLWFTGPDGALTLLGRTPLRMFGPADGGVNIRYAASGGGVAVAAEGGTGEWLVTADGQWAALPPLTPDFNPCTRFADGTICGDRKKASPAGTYAWTCRNDAGPDVESDLGGLMVCPGRVSLGDGTLLSSLQTTPPGDQALREVISAADRAGVRKVPTIPGSVMTVAHAADGTTWGFGRSANGIFSYPVSLTPTGVTEVAEPFPYDREVQKQDMLVDEGLFLPRTGFGMRRFVRPQ